MATPSFSVDQAISAALAGEVKRSSPTIFLVVAVLGLLPQSIRCVFSLFRVFFPVPFTLSLSCLQPRAKAQV